MPYIIYCLCNVNDILWNYKAKNKKLLINEFQGSNILEMLCDIDNLIPGDLKCF